MPRVLRIFNRMIVGGPVLNASFLTRYLAPEFETIMVVGPKEAHEQDATYLARQLGIEVLTIPEMGRSVNPFSDRAAYQKLRQFMQKFNPHIVHTHAAKPGALGRMAAAGLQVPAIVHTYHGHVFHSYFNRFKTGLVIEAERWLARRTHAIVAISNEQKRELVEDFRIAPAGKFHLIRLGLDLDKFGQDVETKRIFFRSAYGLEPGEIAIGIIGRLVPVKNHDLFLEALHHVLQHSTRKVKAFIVGDGETRKHLEALAQAKGMLFSTHLDGAHPHPLVFTSWRKDVDVVMAGLDIVALTSFNEGTPVSLIEAQAAGKPIVSTRVGGIQDVVVEGQTALLADIWDKETFCSQLQQLVDDESLRRHLGANSAAYVVQRYGYKRLVQETGDLYYQLLQQNSKHVFFPEEKYTYPRS
jgi:glycosyltransferase involved in cell wall biosynthesis